MEKVGNQQNISPEQCRMARAALKWSTKELALKAEIGLNTVNRFEGGGPYRVRTVAFLRKALEAGGVKFAASGCVCFCTDDKKKARKV